MENLRQKLHANETRLMQLRKSESKIQNERTNRKTKLEIF